MVANWPEVGLESLLAAFVATFSVKLRLIAGFCDGSNTDNSANGDGDVTCPNITITCSAANRLIGEVVQSRRRPLLGPSPG